MCHQVVHHVRPALTSTIKLELIIHHSNVEPGFAEFALGVDRSQRAAPCQVVRLASSNWLLRGRGASHKQLGVSHLSDHAATSRN
jgi:hypothetical protein